MRARMTSMSGQFDLRPLRVNLGASPRSWTRSTSSAAPRSLAAGVTLAKLRTLAEKLDDNWDLLDRVDAPPPMPEVDLDGWLAEFEAVCAARGTVTAG